VRSADAPKKLAIQIWKKRRFCRYTKEQSDSTAEGALRIFAQEKKRIDPRGTEGSAAAPGDPCKLQLVIFNGGAAVLE
jgi:hypothetical protein